MKFNKDNHSHNHTYPNTCSDLFLLVRVHEQKLEIVFQAQHEQQDTACALGWLIWRVVARKCFHYHSLINYTHTHINTSSCSIRFQLLQTEIITTARIQTNLINFCFLIVLPPHFEIHTYMHVLLYFKIQGTCILCFPCIINPEFNLP